VDQPLDASSPAQRVIAGQCTVLWMDVDSEGKRIRNTNASVEDEYGESVDAAYRRPLTIGNSPATALPGPVRSKCSE